VPKIIVIGHLLLKLLQKNIVTCFFGDTVYFDTTTMLLEKLLEF